MESLESLHLSLELLILCFRDLLVDGLEFFFDSCCVQRFKRGPPTTHSTHHQLWINPFKSQQFLWNPGITLASITFIYLQDSRIPILFFSFLSLGFHWLAVSWPSRLLEAKVHRSQPPVYSSHCHAWAVGFILSQELFFGSILCCELLDCQDSQLQSGRS